MSKIKFYKDSAKTQQVYPELDPEDITKFESLEDIENAFPNVSGEDTNLTLNHTVEAPMRLELAPSELEQKTTTGKNLFDYVNNLKASSEGLTSVINEDGSITTTGKPSADYEAVVNSIDITDMLEDGQTYTISQANLSNKLYMQVNAKKADGTSTYYYYISNKLSQQIKVDKSIYVSYKLTIITGLLKNWGDTSSTITNKYMLCKGTDTADTSFEPYTGGYPQPNPDFPSQVHSVSGDNEVIVCGKNLFDINSLNFENVWIRPTGEKVAANNNGFLSYVEILPNVEYILSLNRNVASIGICEYDKNKNFIQRIVVSNSSSKTIITSTTTKYIGVFINIDGTTLVTKDIIDECEPQLEKSNQATPYEPYQEQSLPLNLGDLEYCKIGTYSDEFFKNDPSDPNYDSSLELDRWYLKKNVGKVVFDGSENNIILQSINSYGIANFQINHNLNSFFSADKSLCDKFTNQSSGISSTTSEGYLWQNNTVYFRINQEKASTVEQFKSWLSTHNTEVYYVLATPQYILLSDTLQHQLDDIYNWVESYPGQTNISQINNDLPFIISARAMKDLSVIDKYPTENSEHLVESGGVYEVVNDINERIADIDTIRHNSKNVVYGSETGANIYLDDAYDTNLVELSIDGVCEQETTSGKNLIDSKWQTKTLNGITVTNNEDGTYTLNGTSTSSTAFALISFTGGALAHPIINNIRNNVGKYITLSTGYSSSQGFYIQLNLSKQAGGGEQYGFVAGVSTYANKLISSNEGEAAYINFFLGIHPNASFNNLKIYPMVTIQDNQISTAPIPTDFEPYTGGQPSPSPEFPQEIKTITDSLKITSTDSNIFDTKNRVLREQIGVSLVGTEQRNSITISGKGSWSNIGYMFKNIKKNTNMVISADFLDNVSSTDERVVGINVYSSEIGNTTEIVNLNGKRETITINSTKRITCKFNSGSQDYIYIRFWNNVTANALTNLTNLTISNIKLEFGNEETAYSELHSQIQANLPEGEFIGKINETYKDTLKVEYNELDGQYHLNLYKNVKKVVLDDNIIGSIRADITTVDTIVFRTDAGLTNIKENSPVICDSLVCLNNIEDVEHIRYAGAANYRFQLFIKRSRLTSEDVNGIKAYLKENPIEVYYALATPYVLDLGIVDITLFNGINHISNSEDADMSITYVKDINIVINKLTNAVVSLGGNV